MPISKSTPHPGWLPDAALRAIAANGYAVIGSGRILEVIRDDLAATGATAMPPERAGLVVEFSDGQGNDQPDSGDYVVEHLAGRTKVTAGSPKAAFHGFHAAVRELALARLTGQTEWTLESGPDQELRMLDHWDNVAIHPVMGQVERGYSGGSIFYSDGSLRSDLERVRTYARLIASTGINAVAVNNVNVHDTEALLLTEALDDVRRIADEFRPFGIDVFMSVAFDSPIRLGGLTTCDPLDPDVSEWWHRTTANVYALIPDFGGFVVKADSEGQPGPFQYGRTHAEGANVIGAALKRHGGKLLWRAFVYDHQQDWRDRKTDRARAAFDHFQPLDGQFTDNVLLQVKHGPMDFQPREPISPVLAALPRTRLAIEFQVTQEYTGQQRHICYLAPMWSEILNFDLDGDLASLASGTACPGGVVAVSNVGDDEFWSGHPLAAANLYAFGRLAWDATLSPERILDEWIALTFSDADGDALPRIAASLHAMMDDSWSTYEAYTAPLGVGFMVNPGHHYGPSVDGYEYSPWGTYHFADRDGVGVDRTMESGTGYTGQYPDRWRDLYDSLETCPDELLLFFHHVPYGHVLKSGKTVIQHIYDSRADAVERVNRLPELWDALRDLVGTAIPSEYDKRVRERLAEQVRSATEWRDQVRSYFYRKSGVSDVTGRTIY